MQGRFTVPFAALELTNAADLIKVRPVRDKPKA
jgi:hypothetical protein